MTPNCLVPCTILLLGMLCHSHASEFDSFVKPLLQQNCLACHGGKEVNGDVDFKQVTTAEQLLAAPELIDRAIEAIDANDMPPEGEPQLEPNTRSRLLTALKTMLREATSQEVQPRVPMRRLNRFQYNNSVKDLFQLRRDVFELPEKLMTRHENYLHTPGTMPLQVQVASHALQPAPGLKGVVAYPRDLPATHGFDNQANRLSLSPLLLDSFLRLSLSIVESEDFNEQTVGIWKDFFQQPERNTDLSAEIRRRLEPFLLLAYRGPIDQATLTRYSEYATNKLNQGLPFATCMKKVASAVLSSPRFFFRSGSVNTKDDQFRLAADLSYFLWGSGPDQQLLNLAQRGELSNPEVLDRTIDRMLIDPKIERFLDSFPSQWLQLANVMAIAPDPEIDRYFRLDKNYPANLQMVLEPLLLFDAVFIDDRPVEELIQPKFGYRSAFLQDWYAADLRPRAIDEAMVARENQARAERISSLKASIDSVKNELFQLDQAVADPISRGLIQVDLSAGQADWEAAQIELIADAVVFSSWHRIGPFPATSFDKAHETPFLHETSVDIAKTYAGLNWEEVPDFVDGQVHQLQGTDCATYLYRRIRAKSARPLSLSLGSDDSFKLWLNGKLVAQRKSVRGVAPDQDRVRLNIAKGDNTLLMKLVNGGGDYGFYFNPESVPLPRAVIASLQINADDRTAEQKTTIASHYLSLAPELADLRRQLGEQQTVLRQTLAELSNKLKVAPRPKSVQQHREESQRRFDDGMREKVRSREFERVQLSDPRFGGVITNAATLSMTSGPKRTHPVARGVWIIEVIFNNPPPPPPNDVPPLNEEAGDGDLTIREKFAVHRENPSCAGCHERIDPLGFALENFDITGRWRDHYKNGRIVDSTGTLFRKHEFKDVVRFKESLVEEKRRFAKALTQHLLRFAVARELNPADSVVVNNIVDRAEKDNFKLRSLIREVILSDSFR